MNEKDLRERLFEIVRSFNEHVQQPLQWDRPDSLFRRECRPGDDFGRRGTWQEVLEPHGWVAVHQSAGTTYWRRPGKDGRSWSATTGHCRNHAGEELFYVFTSSAPPFEPDRCYSKFATLALLEYQGDYSACAKTLARKGYGSSNGQVSRIAPVVAPDADDDPDEAELVHRRRPPVESCTHDELLDMDFPPVPWLVRDLIPDEGMTFLGGKKKLGKSWLALQIAQAIAAGVPVLGRETVQGSVIYICLEDGRRRVKSRLVKQHTTRGLPITYCTRFPPLDGDGMGTLHDLLGALQPKLVIIDTLAAAKTSKTEENAAGAMADIGNYLRETGQYFKCGLLVTHHHGKMTVGDPGNDLRGSSALAGAADVNLGLYREEGGYILRGEGRDIQEFELALSFDPVATWCWQVREDQREALRDSADTEIFDALAALGEADAESVAQYVQKSVRRVRERLNRLRAEGEINVRAEHGGHGGQPRILYSRLRVLHANQYGDEIYDDEGQ